MEGLKKQLGKIGYDTETGMYSGEVIFLYEIETFHAETVEELRLLIRESVRVRREESDRTGENSSKQFFKSLVVCLDPTLFLQLDKRANMANKSLDDYIVDALQEVVNKPQISNLV